MFLTVANSYQNKRAVSAKNAQNRLFPNQTDSNRLKSVKSNKSHLAIGIKCTNFAGNNYSKSKKHGTKFD